MPAGTIRRYPGLEGVDVAVAVLVVVVALVKTPFEFS
jgi:hypothetical protein